MKAVIVANWKMHPQNRKESRRLLEQTKKLAEKHPKVSIIVAPPALYLQDLAGGRGRRVMFAAQNGHFDAEGAHTGEISMTQIKDARATHVLVGHAERRAAGETNEDTRKKVKAALTAGLTPILCIGESKREQGGEHFDVVRMQIRTGFADVPDAKISKVLVAYEPVWAIGAVKPLSPRDMHEMSIFIRKVLVDTRGEAGHSLKILYGGSIDEGNARGMLQGGDVCGILLGRASVSMEHFAPLLDSIS